MEEREMLRRYVENWRELGPKLEVIRRREIREAGNLKVLALLKEAFDHALRTAPPRTTSGMVEMQAGLRSCGDDRSVPSSGTIAGLL